MVRLGKSTSRQGSALSNCCDRLVTQQRELWKGVQQSLSVCLSPKCLKYVATVYFIQHLSREQRGSPADMLMEATRFSRNIRKSQLARVGPKPKTIHYDSTDERELIKLASEERDVQSVIKTLITLDGYQQMQVDRTFIRRFKHGDKQLST